MTRVLPLMGPIGHFMACRVAFSQKLLLTTFNHELSLNEKRDILAPKGFDG